MADTSTTQAGENVISCRRRKLQSPDDLVSMTVDELNDHIARLHDGIAAMLKENRRKRKRHASRFSVCLTIGIIWISHRP